MKKCIFSAIALLMMLVSGAQVVLKTLVTQGPVIAGESFQVQYVLEDADQDADFFQPEFKQFIFVSGPNIYVGASFGTDGPKHLKNITFTLIAPREGKYTVPGASIKLHGKIFRSEPAPLEVISKAAAIAKGILAEKPLQSEESYLRPGEDPYEKMRKNLFMKVSVDRKTCVVGQPVTATFKLYSRLNSKSDIVKNPGFYGFAIQDMVGLADNVSATETVNGKKFEVHTVRKVQLYPLQAGIFTIDPMEVQNKVEFSTSTVGKKTEQEIMEGVMPTEDELFSTPGFKLCESSMHTEPVTIKVNAAPENGKPADFNGSTGRFTVSASVPDTQLANNEEGELFITIEGKGNFTQLAPPVINWPKNIEGFDPGITDSLNKTVSPLEGKRVFRFRFVSTHTGDYTIPPVSFSFFDPDSNKYKTALTKPVGIKITAASAAKTKAKTETGTRIKKTNLFLWIGSSVALLAAVMVIVRRRKNEHKKKAEAVVAQVATRPSVTQLLQPASVLIAAEDNSFYASLRTAIWEFCTQRFGLSGSSMNKRSLQQLLAQQDVSETDQQMLLGILDASEEGLYTGATVMGDRKKLLDETREVLVRIG